MEPVETETPTVPSDKQPTAPVPTDQSTSTGQVDENCNSKTTEDAVNGNSTNATIPSAHSVLNADVVVSAHRCDLESENEKLKNAAKF